MNSQRHRDAEEAAHRGRLAAGHRVEEAGEVQAHLQADDLARELDRAEHDAHREAERHADQRSAAARRARRRPNRAGSPASPAAWPGRRTRSGTRAPTRTRIGTPRWPNTGSAPNSASTRRNGHRIGVIQPRTCGLGEGRASQPTTVRDGLAACAAGTRPAWSASTARRSRAPRPRRSPWARTRASPRGSASPPGRCSRPGRPRAP